jgi:hypothetical protein
MNVEQKLPSTPCYQFDVVIAFNSMYRCKMTASWRKCFELNVNVFSVFSVYGRTEAS